MDITALTTDIGKTAKGIPSPVRNTVIINAPDILLARGARVIWNTQRGYVFIRLQIDFYFFLYVMMIPTTAPRKIIGASLTNTNSNPCRIVPATANSGTL